jgi:hypothetical protein
MDSDDQGLGVRDRHDTPTGAPSRMRCCRHSSLSLLLLPPTHTGHHSSPSAHATNVPQCASQPAITLGLQCVSERASLVQLTSLASVHTPRQNKEWLLLCLCTSRRDWACEQRSNLSGTQGSKEREMKLLVHVAGCNGLHSQLSRTKHRPSIVIKKLAWKGLERTLYFFEPLRCLLAWESRWGFRSPLSAFRGWVRTSFFSMGLGQAMPGQRQPKQPAFCPFEDGHKVRGWL